MTGEPAHWTWRKSLPSSNTHVHRAIDCVLERLSREGWTSHDLFGIHLALEEALVNAVEHGNRGERGKWVHLTCELFPGRVVVQIEDEGAGFQPRDVSDPLAEPNLDQPHGRGLLLMRSYMTKVEYLGRGNCVLLEKERSPVAAVA
jgi:serine/threonine-protein kinase RsbW